MARQCMEHGTCLSKPYQQELQDRKIPRMSRLPKVPSSYYKYFLHFIMRVYQKRYSKEQQPICSLIGMPNKSSCSRRSSPLYPMAESKGDMYQKHSQSFMLH